MRGSDHFFCGQIFFKSISHCSLHRQLFLIKQVHWYGWRLAGDMHRWYVRTAGWVRNIPGPWFMTTKIIFDAHICLGKYLILTSVQHGLCWGRNRRWQRPLWVIIEENPCIRKFWNMQCWWLYLIISDWILIIFMFQEVLTVFLLTPTILLGIQFFLFLCQSHDHLCQYIW